jgi:hypothetical protein
MTEMLTAVTHVVVEDENSDDSLAYGADIRSLRNLAIVALMVVAIIAVNRTSCWSTSILTGLLSNFPSSFIALVLGIPAGLFVARLSDEHRSRATRAEELLRTETQRRTVLRLLRGELKDAVTYFESKIQEVQVGGAAARSLRMPALSVELWTSISRSGDLRLIEDLDLLATIARAYRSIADVRDRESVYYTFLRTVGMTFIRQNASAPWIHQDDLVKIDPVALQVALAAVAAIDDSLGTR